MSREVRTMSGIQCWRAVAVAGLFAASGVDAAVVIDLSWVDQGSAEFQRFKAYVDRAVAGHPDYGFSAADAAYMYELTGQAQYATLAVATVEAQVAAAESDIAGGGVPDIAGDQYLEVGPMIEDLALTYDWCASHVTPTQRTRWGQLRRTGGMERLASRPGPMGRASASMAGLGRRRPGQQLPLQLPARDDVLGPRLGQHDLEEPAARRALA